MEAVQEKSHRMATPNDLQVPVHIMMEFHYITGADGDWTRENEEKGRREGGREGVSGIQNGHLI